MSDTKLREKADALIAFTQQGPRFIAWVKAVTDALAPAPEKVAKVSAFPVGNCVVCGELVAPYNKHAKCEGGYTCQRPQPAPPEPAAPVNGSTPVGEYDPDMKPAAREMPEAVRVGTFQLEELLKWADLAEVSLLGLRISISAVREQFGKRPKLEKVRAFIKLIDKYRRDDELSMHPSMIELGINEALAELDAFEGKGEGRG